MADKRKISYEQDRALAAGRAVARANQRRAVAAREQREREDAERQRELDAHICLWNMTDWQYADDYRTEHRHCRVCGKEEERKVRL